jgi:hypothetical protein
MLNKNNEKNFKPMPLHTSFAHQFSCNTFFLQELFFPGESLKKYVLAYPSTPIWPVWPLASNGTHANQAASKASLRSMFVAVLAQKI